MRGVLRHSGHGSASSGSTGSGGVQCVDGKGRHRDIGVWIKAGYAKTQNNQTLFNIAAIREVVDDAKAQLARAEADGFKIAEPTEYGAQRTIGRRIT